MWPTATKAARQRLRTDERRVLGCRRPEGKSSSSFVDAAHPRSDRPADHQRQWPIEIPQGCLWQQSHRTPPITGVQSVSDASNRTDATDLTATNEAIDPMTPAATAICPPQTPYAPPFQPEIARSHRPLRPPACERAATMLMGGGQLVQDERRQGGNEQTVEVISCPSDLRAGIRRSDRC